MPRARVKFGDELPGGSMRIIKHGMVHPDFDPKHPSGTPGPKAKSGDVINVTNREFAAFSDKLEEVPGDTPLTYTKDQVRKLAIESDLEYADPEVEDEPEPETKRRTRSKADS